MTDAAAEHAAPMPATLVWCRVCGRPRPFANRAVGGATISGATARRWPGLHGEDLVCGTCGTIATTIYVAAEAAA